MTVGFAGMGAMGQPMALNLIKAGFNVVVWNRTQGKTDALVAQGARVANLPAELVREADIIVTMLTGPDAVEQFLGLPDHQVLKLMAGKTLVDMSTVSPAFSQKLSGLLVSEGVRYVDAPVSGSVKPAQEGNLVILAGGDDSTIDAVQPLFEVMGRHTVRCGPVPNSSVAKLAINLLLGSMMEGFAEMVHFTEKAGLDLGTMFEIVTNGALSNALFTMKMPKYLEADYSPQFAVKHIVKDLGFAVDLAENYGFSIPGTEANLQRYRDAVDRGWADEDLSAVRKVLK